MVFMNFLICNLISNIDINNFGERLLQVRYFQHL